MMTAIVTVYEAANFTVSETKTDAMLLRTLDQRSMTSPLVTEAAGKNYIQTTHFLYLGGIIHESADLSLEIERWIRVMWVRLRCFGPELYHMTTAPLSVRVRMLKREVVETLLYGCVTWGVSAKHFARLRSAHRQVLLRVIGLQLRQHTDHTTLSSVKALKKTRCESIESIIRRRRLAFTGAVARRNDSRSHNRVMFVTRW